MHCHFSRSLAWGPNPSYTTVTTVASSVVTSELVLGVNLLADIIRPPSGCWLLISRSYCRAGTERTTRRN